MDCKSAHRRGSWDCRNTPGTCRQPHSQTETGKQICCYNSQNNKTSVKVCKCFLEKTKVCWHKMKFLWPLSESMSKSINWKMQRWHLKHGRLSVCCVPLQSLSSEIFKKGNNDAKSSRSCVLAVYYITSLRTETGTEVAAGDCLWGFATGQRCSRDFCFHSRTQDRAPSYSNTKRMTTLYKKISVRGNLWDALGVKKCEQ